MLYMVGKIFLEGVSFDIVYNESVKNMEKKEKLFIPPQCSEKNQSFLNRDGDV